MTYATTTLGALIDADRAFLQTGPFGSQLHESDYQPEGVIVVPTESIGKRRLDLTSAPRISEAKAEELARHRLKAGDILFARRGIQATGLSALVDDTTQGALCGTGAILLRLTDAEIDPRYLSFYLSAEETIVWLKQHAVGAVMPNLNATILSRLPIVLPALAEQRAIARVLGDLDDKIELNRRMNATLEAMAQALFQSWFVDFEPVRTKAAGLAPEGLDAATASLFPSDFVDSPLGEVPCGWRSTPLSLAIDINPSRVLAKGALAPYLDMANMPTTSARALEVTTREFGSGMKFSDGDTLVARITPCLENGKTCYVDFLGDGVVGWGSTEYIVLRPRAPLPACFAYFIARTRAFRDFAITNMTGTSGRQRVPADCFEKFEVIVPSPEIAQEFGRRVSSILTTMKVHDLEARSLAALRDDLMPQLLSGDLRVPEMAEEAR